MAMVGTKTRVMLKNILYLTDFSEPSKKALPWAITVARNYGAVLHALHVLGQTGTTIAHPGLRAALIGADEEIAQKEMDELDSDLSGINHQTSSGAGCGLLVSR